VASGDLRGIGLQDLVVANSQYPNGTNSNISVLLNNGDGTYQDAVSYDTDTNPLSIAIGDFNGDNKLDLAVANAGGNTVSILLGNGDGTFNPAVNIPVGNNPYGIAAASLRGNGKLDLIVANNTDGSVDVLLGNGDGTFQSPMSSSVGTFPEGVTAADVDGDGKMDVIVANFGSNTVTVLLGKGDGSFKSKANYQVGAAPNFVTARPFTSGGKPDLAVACGDANNPDPLDGLTVLLNKGNGTFQQPGASYSAGIPVIDVIAGDFNGDGKSDLAVTQSSGAVSIFAGNGDGTFKTPASYSVAGSVGLAAADFNNDGKTDLAVTNELPETVTVLLGQGDGTFPTGLALYQLPASLSQYALLTPYSLAIADLHNSGKADLAVGVSNLVDGSGNVSIFSGKGDGTFNLSASYSLNAIQSVAAGKFRNSSNNIDLVASENLNASYDVLLGKGDGTFQTPSTLDLPGAPNAVTVANFHNNNTADLVFGSGTCGGVASTGTVLVLSGNGNGTFQLAVPYPSGSGCLVDTTVGDFNGDGSTDIVSVVNNNKLNKAQVEVLMNNGDGTFAAAVGYPAGKLASAVAVGDFNNDQKTDLVVSNSNGNSVSVLLNRGDGTFAAPVNYAVDLFPAWVGVGDFNGDGNLDIVTANSANSATNGVSILYGNGDGTFQPAIGYAPGVVGDFVAVGDLNNDGAPDLAIADQGDHGVLVLFNTGGTFINLTVTGLQPVTLTATIAPSLSTSGIPTGTITFKDGDTPLNTFPIVSGQASMTTSLGVGTHVLTAAYSGDSVFFPHTSQPVTRVVTQGQTSTSLQTSLNPSAAGQSVVFTASVLALVGGPATGTVTFKDGTTTLGSAPLNGSAQASLPVSSLNAGSHSITAIYNGDGTFTPSTSSPLTQTVTQTSSTTSLQSSPNPSVQGNNVTFTASLSDPFGGATSGTVKFMEGNTQLGSASISAGSATFQTSALTQGLHTITAVYAGDVNHTGSISAGLIQLVNVGTQSTTTTLAFVVNGRNPGQAENSVRRNETVTFTATVDPASGPTGTVTFADGAQILGSATLSSGKAVLTTSSFFIGERKITAIYSGDTTYAGDFSAPKTILGSPRPLR
jgi:hypothetical protein